MSVGILGSGFGLYGYLPAVIVGCLQTAVLPEAYRAKFQNRIELQTLAPSIRWARTEDDLLGEVDTLILARRPADQMLRIDEYVTRPNIARLLLEKPIAPDPEHAAAIQNRLQQSGRAFRIGYNFGLTDWAETLAAALKAGNLGDSWSIAWEFKAHHYEKNLQNWKRSVSQGGGALRFFGIHVVALLAELGYSDATKSRIQADAEDEAETWTAEIVGDGVPPCRVRIDSNAAAPRFSLVASPDAPDRRDLVRLSDPYAQLDQVSDFDLRLSIVARLCGDLLSGIPPYYPWYERTVQLWAKVERLTERRPA